MGIGNPPGSRWGRYSSFTHRRSTSDADAIYESGVPFSISGRIHRTFLLSSVVVAPSPARGAWERSSG